MPDPLVVASQKDAERVTALADKALEAADAKELHALVGQLAQDRTDLLRVVDMLTRHYAGEKDVARLTEPPVSADAIGAMERVALAAIDLARSSLRPPTDPES